MGNVLLSQVKSIPRNNHNWASAPITSGEIKKVGLNRYLRGQYLIHLIFSTESLIAKMSEEFHAKLETTAKSKRLEKKEKYFSRFKRRQWEDRNPNDEKRIKKDDSSEDRIKRRKCCLLMGYSGVDYFGMQR